MTAADVLKAGGVVLLPTDTVYGIAVDPTVPNATQKLFDLKGRRRDIPIAVLVADEAQAWSVAKQPVPEAAVELAQRHWPGALTIIVERDPDWTGDLGDNISTVGLRCPDAPYIQDLCRDVGPLATSSANLHGQPTPVRADEAAAQLNPDLVVDGGAVEGTASTVVDCTVDPPRVVRQGSVVL